MTLAGLFFANTVQADYLQRFAQYQTISRSNRGVDTVLGTSEVRVISFNTVNQRYTVKTTHHSPQAADVISTHEFLEAELKSQDEGQFFKNCEKNYGTLGSQVPVKGALYDACRITSSNSSLDVGIVPFSVLRSISQANRKTIITQLIDFHP